MKISKSMTGVALCILAAFSSAAQSGDGTVARLVDLDGSVLVSRDSTLRSGDEAQRLLPGTRVLTTLQAKVVVEFDDGCRVRLERGQRLEVGLRTPCSAVAIADASKPGRS